MDSIDKVREKLKGQVPLVQHMGVDLVLYEPGRVVVEAPLEPNLNTHGTAFGGSLYCVATMCGWSLVHLTLMDAGYDPSVWVTRGEVVYHKPVRGAIRAEVSVGTGLCAALVDEYQQKGRTRADLVVQIYNEQRELALTLEASYAAR
ncbi:MAG: YiiD C-terminal domain-containing protein [Ketobacteraceae bacterium]|nr:YiiD C-terminal domain-containing protein [Ketobacteraceae bacterium]